MCNRLLGTTILLNVLLLLGCGGDAADTRSPLSTGPSALPSASPTAPPAGPATSITGISPETGVVTGATLVQISGSGPNHGTVATFGGVQATSRGYSPRGEAIWVVTPGHAAGPVDVVVTNRDGQSGRLEGGFTYGVAAPLVIAALSTPEGSTAGGTYLSIGGSGFQPGTKVTLDGAQARIIYNTTPTWVTLTTPPHAPGAVDIVVTAADGQVARLERGYTYVAPPFSDFNGVWEGHVGDEGELTLRFTVENDTLVSVTCGGRIFSLASLPSTSGGEFADAGSRGVNMTGALVRSDYAEGTINGCTYDTVWFATRR